MNDLAAVRAGAFRVGFFLVQHANAPAADRAALSEQIDRALDDANQAESHYAAHPQLPGEAEHARRVSRALRRLETSAEQVRAAVAVGLREYEVRALNAEFRAAADEVVAAAAAASGFNARAADEFSRQLRELRERTRRTNFIVELLFGGLVATGALLLRRRARAEAAALEERSAELEQFAGRVAHDIRNPLSAALTASHLILRKTDDPAVQSLANRSAQSLSRANGIIGGLLDFARSGARPDPGARTDVRGAAEALVSGIQPDAEAAGIQLSLEELPRASAICSEGIFHSILGNLIRNAIKYMGDSELRRIIVHGRMVDQHIRVEVTDTGPGIASDDIPSLFELYSRLQGSKAEGIGLGLATVRRLAESHHGSVGVDSRPGAGSTFWFELPAVAQTASVFTEHAAVH